MKQLFSLLTTLVLFGTLTACGGTGTQSQPEQTPPAQEEIPAGNETASPSTPAATDENEPAEGSQVLVACFSATGNTEAIAQHIQAAVGADYFSITPQDPYTSDDLNYNDNNCRANQEQNDPNARPALSGTLENLEEYDVVFLGYPIWWGRAPKILYTFLESYDWGDATIVPFCTSGSSGISGSLEDLQALAPHANWLEGQRFDSGASQDEVAQWVDSLGLGL